MGERRAEVPTPTLAVRRHTGALSELEPVWQRLVDPAQPGAPFRTFAWISSWWSAASTSTEAEVLVAHLDNQVVGLLPLYAERTPLGGRRLRLMGDGIVGSDWLGAIALPEHAGAVARAFAAQLSTSRACELQLDDLAGSDPLLAGLGACAAVEVEARFKCPYIRVQGTFDGFLRQLPDGIGAQLHRRERWLQKRPGFQFETLSTPAEVERGMKVLFDLHRQRWALEGGSDAIDGPKVETFHLEAAHQLSLLGWSRVWLMHVDGAPRAALYGWRHGDRLAFYQAGHEPAWRPRSVGTVLLGHVIRCAFEEQLAEFDFLRGDEPYKLKWATGFRETVRLRARGEGLRPLCEDGARRGWRRLKQAARAALPPETFQKLQAIKKQLLDRRGES